MNDQIIRVKRHFNSSAETLFDAWLQPEQAKQFLFATDTGTMKTVEINAVAGGTFRIVETRPEGDVEHLGEYLEITRPSKLVFLFWVPQFSDLKTTISIDIISQNKGCDLTLTHEGVLPEYAERTQQGWTQMLESLARVVD